jgi:hypothetical protein
MNNLEINRILRAHHKTKNIFITSSPCNIPPYSSRYPYALVMNTDDSRGSGIHWIAMYVTSSDTVESFDPSGLPPNECISRFLRKFKEVKQNPYHLQAFNSSVCGHYCVYFIIRRCSGDSFASIIKRLHEMGDIRDSYVREYVSQLEQCLIPTFS